jgi:hypothetical protein
MLFALFPRRGGYPPELDNPDNLLVLGRTLGAHARARREPPVCAQTRLDIAAVIADSRAVLPHDFVPDDLGAAYTEPPR